MEWREEGSTERDKRAPDVTPDSITHWLAFYW